HRHFRPHDYEVLQRQAADRHRRYGPSQSRHPQPLRQRFRQAMASLPLAKQYLRDRANLRTEPATNNVYDYGVLKGIENLPKLREKQSAIIDRYLDVQHDILVSFIDRGQLHQLRQSTVLSNGKRVPGLKLDSPRLDRKSTRLNSSHDQI